MQKIQSEENVTFAAKLDKSLGKINWSKSAEEINNLIKGLLPWPTAHTSFNEKALKILKADVVLQTDYEGEPGEIITIDKMGMLILTGVGCLMVEEVHYESSKRMSAYEFSIGQHLKVGDKIL